MEHRKRQKIIVMAITVIFLIIVGGYVATMVWGLSEDENTPGLVKVWVLGIILLILCPIIVMMVVIAVKRQKEIDEEDEDDLSQY